MRSGRRDRAPFCREGLSYTVARAFLILLVLAGHVSSTFGQHRFVDLDTPGAMEALARDNPRHYETVRGILAQVQAQPYSEVPRWLPTRFDVHDVDYGPLLLTSLPPKRHLSFAIDEVRYHTLLTLQSAGTNQQALLEQGRVLEEQALRGTPSSTQFGREAVKVYFLAAKRGSGAAAKRLAEIYDRGLPGVPRDPDEALRWRNAARVLGEDVLIGPQR